MPISLSGSLAVTGSITTSTTINIADTTNPVSFTSTASFYSDGGARFTKDMFVSGTAYFNNVTVYGTQSVCFITSSQLNISNNLISVNTATPTVRFGGLAVYDSGSTGLTGSILWDSENNHWIYSNPSGSSYSGGMFISGPRTSTLGSETGTTSCMLLAGQGGDHLTSSMIYHSSTVTCIPNTLVGSTICSTMANASCVGIGTTTPAAQFHIFNNNTYSAANLNETTSSAMAFRIRTRAGINTNIVMGAFDSTQAGLQVVDSATAAAGCFLINPYGGNVGIGCIAPIYPLDVKGAAGTIARITDGTSHITFYAGSGLNEIATVSPMLLTVNGTERVRITSTGIACFSCQICVPNIISTGVSGGRYATFNAPTNGGYITFEAGGTSFGDLGSYCAQYGTGDATTLLLGSRTGYALSLGTNSTERLRITCAGNVGIGTTSPGRTVHILGQTGIGTVLKLEGAAGTTTYLQLSYNGATNVQSGYIGYDSSANMPFFTNDTERMRITSGGSVGIGTTSPYSNGLSVRGASDDYSLTVLQQNTNTAGYGFFAGNSGDFSIARLSGGTYTSAALKIQLNTNVACFSNTVCVGGTLVVNGNTINVNCDTTTATDARINLYTRNSVNGDRASIYTYNLSATTTGYELTYLAFGYCCTNNQGYINMQTKSGGAWCNTMNIINGRVGIGTTNPSEKLELSGTGNIYARITATDASNAGVRFNAAGAREYGIFSDGALRFYDFTAATERMRITSGGSLLTWNTVEDVYDTNVSGNVKGYWTNQFSTENGTSKTLLGAAGTAEAIIGFASLNSSSKYIITAGIYGKMTSSTAGAETGDLVFYTKPPGGGMSSNERMRIKSLGDFDYGGYNVMTSSNSYYRQAFYGALSIMWRNAEDAYINSNHTYDNANANIASYASSNGLGRINMAGGNLEWSTYNGSVSAGTGYTLSQKFGITKAGIVMIGTTSCSTEANLFLGAQGTIEGGQMVFQKGTSCSCATHLDNYQDAFRILVGSDTSSNGVHMLIDHKTRNTCFYGTMIQNPSTISNNNAPFGAEVNGGYKYFSGTLANGEKFGSQGGTYVQGFFLISWFNGSSGRGYGLYATVQPAANAGTVLISSGGTYTASASYNASNAVSLAFDGSSRGAVLSNNTGATLTFYAYVFGGV